MTSRPAPPTLATPSPGDGGLGASFGDRVVRPEDKQHLVDGVFHEVAERYDLMNDLLSGGLHRLWKDELVAALGLPRSSRPFRHLDVAGGTGDIAIKALRAGGSGVSTVLLDINPDMLRVGGRRIADARLEERVTLVEGNAESLPFADRSFDAYSIAFGIRNVPRMEAALAEAYRVLRPGGRFACLEFSRVDVPLLDTAYDTWSRVAIPRIGELVAGSAEPYLYLVESIRRFPDQEHFKALIAAAGFSRVAYRNLTGGIAALHTAWRI
jgi:demethylmenaquinone methyltransferase/2-methoxy-6-polyprenyl-1,4-benzoquinol methylase